MADRPVYLAKFRSSPNQRAHFAIYVPNADHAEKDISSMSTHSLGTLIHVIGAPMTGFFHEFKRNYDPTQSAFLQDIVRIASINSEHIRDPENSTLSKDNVAMGRLDFLALQLSAPRISQNFLAPINHVSDAKFWEMMDAKNPRQPIETANCGS